MSVYEFNFTEILLPHTIQNTDREREMGSSSSITPEEGEAVRVNVSRLPGFGFCPTDELLIRYYLKNKIEGTDSHFRRIFPEIDLCKYEPGDIPVNENEWVFFTRPKYKDTRCPRRDRLTHQGFYKITGDEREIRDEESKAAIGKKIILTFHEGRGPKAKKSDWVIHEYYCTKTEVGSKPTKQMDFVLCRLKNRSPSYKKPKGDPTRGELPDSGANSEDDQAAGGDVIAGPVEHLGYKELGDVNSSESPDGSCLIDYINILSFDDGDDETGDGKFPDLDDPAASARFLESQPISLSYCIILWHPEIYDLVSVFVIFGLQELDGLVSDFELFVLLLDFSILPRKIPNSTSQLPQPPQLLQAPEPHQPPHPHQTQDYCPSTHQPPEYIISTNDPNEPFNQLDKLLDLPLSPPELSQPHQLENVPGVHSGKFSNWPSPIGVNTSYVTNKNNIATNYENEPVINIAFNRATDERISEVYSQAEENLGLPFQPFDQLQNYAWQSPMLFSEVGELLPANNYIGCNESQFLDMEVATFFPQSS
ncbi:hypothetical protein D8674_000860 [Pyrus ussuriensis x Pyrus communis]|uniref:NAC domain-containing protein n=1 Tax=Pyrus ussuriensis x Pyrus communis TaxID=2448454 RepID=A0A5N5F9Z3_9ROSA|nr:hypothetical protein D8674_000860 [Pyrus ussuriensis x Pyrus communis]